MKFLLAILILLVGFVIVIRLFFGKGVADMFLGRLLYDLFVLPFRLLGFLIKLLWRHH